jgi:2'-5' RNA ligase
VPYAVELALDPAADARVRAAWAALDAAGVPSLGSVPGAAYDPHVSLAVLDGEPDPDAVAAALRRVLRDAAGTPLPLEHLGFFLTAESVAFLGVRPTTALLALHERTVAAVAPLAEVWPYYRPGAPMPHCTLAMGVRDHAAVVAVLARAALPVPAVAAGAHLVDVATGRRVAGLA